ncbi:MAG: TetR/AcrR family transcriptional regulator [Verrucomicrobiota bacterium]
MIAMVPRKDLSQERIGQILDAFESSILRFGLEGSSLEKVAESAGMKRTIIRHYVGNRDELISAMTARLVERYREQTTAMFEALGEEDRVETLIQILFSRENVQSAESIMIFEHLVLAGNRYESVRKPMADWTMEFVEMVEDELRRAFPTSKDTSAIAFGLTSIYFNYVSLLPLQLPALIREQSIVAARKLVGSGENS